MSSWQCRVGNVEAMSSDGNVKQRNSGRSSLLFIIIGTFWSAACCVFPSEARVRLFPDALKENERLI